MYPTNYYIALGTNVGNYKNNFFAAIRELNKLGQISKIANIYQSKPYGYLNQNYFYNSVLELKSKMMPMQLMKNIQLIEKKLQTFDEVDISDLLKKRYEKIMSYGSI